MHSLRVHLIHSQIQNFMCVQKAISKTTLLGQCLHSLGPHVDGHWAQMHWGVSSLIFSFLLKSTFSQHKARQAHTVAQMGCI